MRRGELVGSSARGTMWHLTSLKICSESVALVERARNQLQLRSPRAAGKGSTGEHLIRKISKNTHLEAMLRNVLRQTAAQCCHQHLQRRTLLGWLMYSSKKGVDRDLLAFIQQPIDMSPEAIARWAKRKKWEALKNDHKFVRDRHQTLGPDLATSHFIVKRGGAVKFVNSNRWIEKDKEGNYRLPDRMVSTFKLEAVDASNTEIMYTSFDNFVDLRSLRYLNLSNCENIDDWCIDRLQQVKRSLVCLDVSGCKGVTENGLAALHKLNLRCLRAHHMGHIEQQGLLKLMLQEAMPLCTLEGLDAPRGEEQEQEAFTTTSLPQHEQRTAHSKQ